MFCGSYWFRFLCLYSVGTWDIGGDFNIEKMITTKNLGLLVEFSGMKNLLLLGSQTLNIPGLQGVQATKELPAVDLDINGEADYKVDLSKFQGDKFGDGFGCVADFGTMEHVGDPGKTANGLRNVFAWVKDGGVIIHVNPSPDYVDPEQHDKVVRFTVDFWKAYAELSEMEILKIGEELAYDMAPTAPETVVVMRKVEGSLALAKKDIVSLIKEECEYV